MKIIDAHLHIFGERPWAERMAQQVGHRNSAQHLVQYYARHGFAHGIVMANAPLTEHTCRELPPQFSYCIGLDSGVMQNLPSNAPEIVEAHLQKSTCVGIKLYPGYNHSYTNRITNWPQNITSPWQYTPALPTAAVPSCGMRIP